MGSDGPAFALERGADPTAPEWALVLAAYSSGLVGVVTAPTVLQRAAAAVPLVVGIAGVCLLAGFVPRGDPRAE